jgi:hypothetical protein
LAGHAQQVQLFHELAKAFELSQATHASEARAERLGQRGKRRVIGAEGCLVGA